MEFENLMQDREFCEKLENAENDDVIIQLFAEKGFSVTKEQIEEARAATQQEELDEESLDGVSGGILLGAASWGGRFLVKLISKWGRSTSSGGGSGGGGVSAW